MIKQVLLGLCLSVSVTAFAGASFAQTSPDTRQTDQSEEDWRKSKKKRGNSSDDIIDVIKNTRSIGSGSGRGYSPIESLPEDSREFLMKERARRMAQAGINEPVDVTYKPSPEAQNDPNLQTDEKAAWEDMTKGLNDGTGGQSGQGQGNGQSPASGQSDPNQAPSGQQQSSQSGQSSSSGQGSGQGSGSSNGEKLGEASRSVMRGGSANSVSDILAQIQGRGSSPSGQPQGQTSGQAPSGQSPNGQSPSGQSPNGKAPNEQARNGQAQNGTQQSDQGKDQDQAQAQNSAQSQDISDTQSQAHGEAHAKEAQAQAQNQNSVRTPEAISPLNRLKTSRQEQNRSGNNSSASDYLKTGK